MKRIIQLELECDGINTTLKNANGDTFEFKTYSSRNEELTDFLSGAKQWTFAELKEIEKNVMIQRMETLISICDRYEKEKQGLYSDELVIVNDIKQYLKINRNDNSITKVVG